MPDGMGGDQRPPAYLELRAELAASPAWGDLVGRLSAFHHAEGTGELAAHRVLRLGANGLAGVVRPDPISLADLEGGEAQQAPLGRDLEAFVTGRGANDALIYGPPGTGKSATVRGLASLFADRGLRLVQVDRGEIERLGSVFAELAGEGPHCLVYLDDLAFDDGGRTDRVLRSALEGGVVERPANVLVWVTSNRLRLTRETHAERADDIEGRLAVGEKTALATRFGRRVAFRAPSQEAYLAICRRLVRERLGTVPGGTDEAALRFAVAGHGMTQRTARQFAGAFRPEES
jgi:predicted AAA+ superfamily ATPase